MVSGHESKPSEKKVKKAKDFAPVPFALELGFSIAIPLVALLLAGRLLDKHFGTSPILLLTGVFISFFVSSAIVYLKVIPFFTRMGEPSDRTKEKDIPNQKP